MKAYMILLTVAVLVAGCGGHKGYFKAPAGYTDAQIAQDRYECLQAAYSVGNGGGGYAVAMAPPVSNTNGAMNGYNNFTGNFTNGYMIGAMNRQYSDNRRMQSDIETACAESKGYRWTEF